MEGKDKHGQVGMSTKQVINKKRKKINQKNRKEINNQSGTERKRDKEQMLISMPYLTIKHETRVPSRSFRGEEKCSLAHQIEVVVHQVKRPEMCERALSIASALPCRAPTCRQA